MPIERFYECMHVIGHHDESIQNITVAIEMPQGICNDFGRSRIAQKAGTDALVEPPLARFDKAFFVSGALMIGPRLGILLQPTALLFLPFMQERLRDGIRQTERDEISRTALFPMRQMASRNFYLAALVKAAEGGHLVFQ